MGVKTANRSARPSAHESPRRKISRRSTDRDLRDALLLEDDRGSIAQVALQHDCICLDGATATECLLELLAPLLELGRLESELLDDRHFLPSATLSFHANDRTGRTFGC